MNGDNEKYTAQADVYACKTVPKNVQLCYTANCSVLRSDGWMLLLLLSFLALLAFLTLLSFLSFGCLLHWSDRINHQERARSWQIAEAIGVWAIVRDNQSSARKRRNKNRKQQETCERRSAAILRKAQKKSRKRTIQGYPVIS